MGLKVFISHEDVISTLKLCVLMLHLLFCSFTFSLSTAIKSLAVEGRIIPHLFILLSVFKVHM